MEKKKEERKQNLFELIEDSIGVGEVPVKEELVDDGEVVSGFGEAGEEFVDVALGLFLDEAAEPGEEPGLAGLAREAGCGGGLGGEPGSGEVEGEEGGWRWRSWE